jgi:hypothetical protein
MKEAIGYLRVSTRVNAPKNNDPTLIEPIAA